MATKHSEFADSMGATENDLASLLRNTIEVMKSSGVDSLFINAMNSGDTKLVNEILEKSITISVEKFTRWCKDLLENKEKLEVFCEVVYNTKTNDF